MNETAVHPDKVLKDLLAKGRRSTIRKNLKRLHEICRRQYEAGSKDFSRSTIGRIAEDHGLFQARILYNKSSADYVDLVQAWGTYAGPYTPKRQSNTKASEDFLFRIEDPAIRSIMQSVIAERDRLRGELNILKSTTVFTIDRRPKTIRQAPITNTEGAIIVEVDARLNPIEKEALEHAVSPVYLEARGLREGDDGEIYNRLGFMLFEPGFTNAIRTVLAMAVLDEKP